MQLKSEDFIHHEDYNFSVYKRFKADGLDEFDNNVYDKEGRLLIKYSREYPEQFGLWNILFESKYQYDDSITRIFKYKTGYTQESHQNPKWDAYGFEIENNEIIYPLNELVEIKEIIYDNNNCLILNKCTDLKKNSISEKKFSYNENRQLIEEVEIINNQIVSKINTSYADNKINFISNGIYKTYYKFNEIDKLIEINVYELKLDAEVFYGKISLDFEADLCTKIQFNIITQELNPNEDFDFYEYLLNLFNVTLHEQLQLPFEGYYINSNMYYYLKRFGILCEYYNNSDIKQITLFGDNINGFLDRRFYLFEYCNSFKEYVAGFSINNNEIKHLFSHKFNYYK